MVNNSGRRYHEYPPPRAPRPCDAPVWLPDMSDEAICVWRSNTRVTTMVAASIILVKRSMAGKIAVFVLSRVSKTTKMLFIPFRHCWDARSTVSDNGTRYHEYPSTPSTMLLHGKTRTWSMGQTAEGTYSKSCALVCFVLLALPFLSCGCSARMFLTLSHPTCPEPAHLRTSGRNSPR